jgi:hypothetical protein
VSNPGNSAAPRPPWLEPAYDGQPPRVPDPGPPLRYEGDWSARDYTAGSAVAYEGAIYFTDVGTSAEPPAEP